MSAEGQEQGQGQQDRPQVGDVRQNEQGAFEIFVKRQGKVEWVSSKDAAEGHMLYFDHTQGKQQIAEERRKLDEERRRLQDSGRYGVGGGQRGGFGDDLVPPGSYPEQPPTPRSGTDSERSLYGADYSQQRGTPNEMNQALAPLVRTMREMQGTVTELRGQLDMDRQLGKLKQKYSDFDRAAIEAELAGLTREEQEQYDTPLGWESLHLQMKLREGESGEGTGTRESLAGVEQRSTPFAESNRGSAAQFRGREATRSEGPISSRSGSIEDVAAMGNQLEQMGVVHEGRKPQP